MSEITTEELNEILENRDRELLEEQKDVADGHMPVTERQEIIDKNNIRRQELSYLKILVLDNKLDKYLDNE